MLRPGSSFAVLGFLAVLTSTGVAAARPFRVMQVPNGPVAACLTCHVYPGGPRNAFGNTVEGYGGVGFLVGGNVQWGNLAIADPAHPGDPPKTLAELDSDGDGRTNGEELLDPTGSWRPGQPDPGDPALARLPGRQDSKIVIRQIFAGGGATGSPYQRDFIELFNRSTSPVSLAGTSLQYATAAGARNFGGGPASITELPAVVLQPGQSFLVEEAAGAGPGSALPAPDFTDATPIALDEVGGKVVLVSTTASLGCNGFPTICSDAAVALILDLVGYGSSTFFYEGIASAPSTSAGTALTRARNGCTDINSNGSDFPPVVGDFSLAAPAPRNSASPASPCGGGAAIAAQAVPALGASQLALLMGLLGLLGVRRIGLRACFEYIRSSSWRLPSSNDTRSS